VVRAASAIMPDAAYCGRCGALKAYPELARDLVRLGAGDGTLVVLDAYTAGNVLLGSVNGPSNNLGHQSLLAFANPNIAYVKIHDSGNFFMVDDFSFTPKISAVPLPAAAWMGMTLIGGIGAAKRLRRKNVEVA